MRTGDDRRREIAQALRGLSEGDSFAAEAFERDVYYDALVLWAIRASVGRGDIFPLLADLIDRPTCHLVEDEDGYTACSECGCTALCMSDAVFCPDCGARIVRKGATDDQ